MSPMCVDKDVVYLTAHRYPFKSSRPLKSIEIMVDGFWLGRNCRRSAGVIIDVINVIPPQLFLFRGSKVEKRISGN